MSNNKTARFSHLPLGARFSYAGNKKIYVKITPTTVAEWDEERQLENWQEKWVSQGVFSFGENIEEIVDVCVKQELNIHDMDFPEPYASIQIDCETGISIAEKPSHKTVEVYTRHQFEQMIDKYKSN